MSTRLGTFLAAAALAVPVPCLSEERDRLDIVVSAFAALHEADPGFAQSLAQQLAEAIERDPRVRIVASGPARYRLEGDVLADGQRQFAALRLIDTSTDKIVWCENYDYRGITADMMAADLLAALPEPERAVSCLTRRSGKQQTERSSS